VDRVICQIVGTKPKNVPTLIAAEWMGKGITNVKDIAMVGDDLKEAKDFQFGGQQLPRAMGKIGLFVPLVKNSVNSRPVVEDEICNLCELCVQHCPAEAMEIQVLSTLRSRQRFEKDEGISIDLDKCFRCYCCSEVCPEGAISVRQGWLWKYVPGWMK
jgi:uncharacterized Fe-S center protein